MSVLAWILLGLVAGVVAGKIVGRDDSLLGDIVIGILGALIGGFLFQFFGERGITGINPWSFMVAIVGAVVLTLLPEALRFLQERRDIVNGLIIMVSIIFLPRGLADPRFWGGRLRPWLGRRQIEPERKASV